jgi:TonB family protein
MKQLTSLLFLLSFTAAFAGKSFRYEVTVLSIVGRTPMEGIIVRCVPEKGEIAEMKTNAEGKAIFPALRAKEYKVSVIDPSGLYQADGMTCFNKKRRDMEDMIVLSFNAEKEQQLIADKTFRAPEDTTGVLSCLDDSFEPAEYPGGNSELMRFISHNVRYPQEAIENDIQGKVYISFIVEKDGSISGVRVVRGVSKELDFEAIRVVCYFPNFIPGKCDGQTVRSRYNLPINFRLM